MKTILIPLFAVLSLYTYVASGNSATDHTSTEDIKYVQCVVVKDIVQSCTDITSGRLIDTAKVDAAYIK